MRTEDLLKLENYDIEDETLKRLVYKAVRELKNTNKTVEINGETSDGYHTFNELYEHRTKLFACICNEHKDISYKARKHYDGTGYEDMFLACVKTPLGDYSYHCDMKYWDLFNIEAREFADKWDGHLPKDIDRVLTLTNYNIITAPKSIKLSEIVSKLASELEDEYEEEIYYNKDIKCIGFGEYDKYWFQNTWFTLVRFNKDFSIRDINLPLDFNFKWLYELWIAGTEIIDDMESDE